ncbi:hypothetical protein F2Q69_00001728 [Brassica cretica]|uniref:Uncharacterized protein n=1 Tax=Brassica cretica TaxID=69181 RepID=A0A8S9PBT3_BRACR|nr:hypothetical protein F2Q69_00001728 [Brassica cretica]
MTEENAKEREDNAGEREIMRNDEDGTMDETQTQSHDLRNIEEPFNSVKNVEGSVVVRDEKGEIESAETMVETEKKDFKEGYHYKKTAAYRGKKASVYRRNNVIPTTYRRNKSSEITHRKFIFPRKSLGNFRRNSEEMNFRGNSEDHQFVRKILGIYRGRTSSGYFDGLSDGPIFGSSDEMFLGIFIGNFRETEHSENSEEGIPLYIPTTYSEEMFIGNFRGFISSEFKKK